MSPRTRLGRCPRCQRAITDGCVLIEYAGGSKVYAECPECRDVVRPA